MIVLRGLVINRQYFFNLKAGAVSYTHLCVTVFTFLLALMLTSVQSISQDDKNDIFLRKISQSYSELSYSATINIEAIENGEVVRKNVDRNIIAGPEKRWARRISPGSYYSNKEVVHIGNLYYVRVIGTDSVYVRNVQPRSGELADADDMILLKKNYTIKFLREEKIQDRVTDVVKIKPLYRDRPCIKICVDRENGFIFYLEKYDKDSNIIYRRYAEDVEFNPVINESVFDVTYTGPLPGIEERETYESIGDMMQDIKGPILIPKQVPPGFVLEMIQVTRRENVPVIQFYYKDGLTGLSFFQIPTKKNEQDAKVVDKRMSGTIIVRAIKDNIDCRFIGDLPADTMIGLFKNLEKVVKNDDLNNMQ